MPYHALTVARRARHAARRFRRGAGTAASLVRPGDWLVLGTAVVLLIWLFGAAWQRPAANDVTIRAGGRVFLQTTLGRDQMINVPGPLGTSVIQVRNHRVRVARDPSPRQYCVRQGWLAQAGDTAICLPNQTSVELGGAKALYDSLAY